MKILFYFFHLILDSIFPISKADRIVLSYSPEKAFNILPRAPKTPVSNTESVFAYKNNLVTRLIWNIKYKKSLKAVKIGGYALYRQLKEKYFPSCLDKIILIPMPITSRRRKERGFNQCELIIEEIKSLDIGNRMVTENNLLERVVHKDRQTLKNRKNRLIDSKGVFALNKIVLEKLKSNYGSEYQNLSIVIIDDVITTGSTIKEAMETLKEAGFDHVIGISLAH